jgi:hypothetical protein
MLDPNSRQAASLREAALARTPILPVEESAAIAGEAVGYRDSIGA